MTNTITIHIRSATTADEPFLWDMLYQALYVPEGHPPFPREILQKPAIAHYVQGWGAADDIGFIAEAHGRPVGAAWSRLFPSTDHGYGYVNDETPELTIAILPDYRGRGIGRALLTHLFEATQHRYPALSLSVSPGNPAFGLYQRLGFETVGDDGSSLTMVKKFLTSTSS